MKNDKTKHKYLVGWQGDIQCVYGRSRKDGLNFVDPLTLQQMKRLLKVFRAQRGTLVVYELKPYARLKVKPWEPTILP